MFNIKIYDINGNYKKVLGEEFMTFEYFSSQINGGLSDTRINIKTSIIDDTYSIGDFFKIYLKGKLIYSGNIFFINRFLKNTYEYIQLHLMGLASWLTNEEINKTFTNQETSEIIKSLIDNYNTARGSDILTYDTDSIPSSGDSETFSFNISYLEYFQKVVETSGIAFFIDENGKVFYKNDSDIIHPLTVGKDISSIEIGETDSNLIKNDKVANTIELIVNNQYDYWEIKPGDNIKIRNIKYEINNLKVAKISYGEKEARIELENFNSFSDLVLGN